MKRKNKRKVYNRDRGISLISLVVAIIVMLILAGVAFKMAAGENGIIDRAEEASEITDNAIKNEDAYIGNLEDKILEEGNSNTIILKIGNTDLSKAVKNIKTNTALKEYYGQETNFKSIEGVKWQLFYDDETYYYLIASDYVKNSTLPNELIKSTNAEQSYSEYCAYFINKNNWTFSGTIMDTNKWNVGTDSVAIKNNKITNKYLKWVNSSLVQTKNYYNMMATAYMMDTEKWNDFAGKRVVNAGGFAIGGPTMELFAKSYNTQDSHPTKIGEYDTINDENANLRGYNIKVGQGNWNAGSTGLSTNNGNGDMWVITNTQHAKSMWIASPSAYDTYVMCIIYSNGGFGAFYSGVDSNEAGFRPIVVIPKT